MAYIFETVANRVDGWYNSSTYRDYLKLCIWKAQAETWGRQASASSKGWGLDDIGIFHHPGRVQKVPFKRSIIRKMVGQILGWEPFDNQPRIHLNGYLLDPNLLKKWLHSGGSTARAGYHPKGQTLPLNCALRSRTSWLITSSWFHGGWRKVNNGRSLTKVIHRKADSNWGRRRNLVTVYATYCLVQNRLVQNRMITYNIQYIISYIIL